MVGDHRWWVLVAFVALACGSVDAEEAREKGCETRCEYRLACLFDSPAGVPACAMACPESVAAATGECRDALEALGRCVEDRDEVTCPGFLAGFCADAFEAVASACEGDRPDGGVADGSVADLGVPDDAGSMDASEPMDLGADLGCEPATCESAGAECGTIADGCGGDPIECPTCSGALTCQDNRCVSECVPNRNRTRQATLAVSNGPGDEPWINPSGALMTADGLSASADLRSMDVTEALTSTGWGFTLPTDATVEGVEVSIVRTAAGNTADASIALVADGASLGAPKTAGGNWPSTPAAQRYGGATDRWGATITPAQVNASDFGVAIRAQQVSGSPSLSEVEHVTMTVHYSVPCP